LKTLKNSTEDECLKDEIFEKRVLLLEKVKWKNRKIAKRGESVGKPTFHFPPSTNQTHVVPERKKEFTNEKGLEKKESMKRGGQKARCAGPSQKAKGRYEKGFSFRRSNTRVKKEAGKYGLDVESQEWQTGHPKLRELARKKGTGSTEVSGDRLGKKEARTGEKKKIGKQERARQG